MASAPVLHLLFERPGLGAPEGGNAGTEGKIPGWGLPLVLPGTAFGLDIGQAGISLAPDTNKHAQAFLTCLPVPVSHPTMLLILSPSLELAVNGRPVPPVTLLKELDELMVEGVETTTLHLVRFHGGCIGPAPVSHLGRPCPLCRVRLTSTATVYACTRCGTCMHQEDAGGHFLNCASVAGSCPVCGEPVRLISGYHRLPGHYPAEAIDGSDN